jgi:hypothetical protein
MGDPIADLFARFRGKSCEAQTSLLRHIGPRHGGVGFDWRFMVREPETDCPIPWNRIKGVEAKSFIRNVQHDAAVIRLNVDVGVSLHRRPWGLAAIRASHWQHQ